jgi:hypothetical protein
MGFLIHSASVVTVVRILKLRRHHHFISNAFVFYIKTLPLIRLTYLTLEIIFVMVDFVFLTPVGFLQNDIHSG